MKEDRSFSRNRTVLRDKLRQENRPATVLATNAL